MEEEGNGDFFMSAGNKLTGGFNNLGMGDGEMLFSDLEALMPGSLLNTSFGASADPAGAGKGQYWKPEEPATDPDVIDNFRKMILGNDL